MKHGYLFAILYKLRPPSQPCSLLDQGVDAVKGEGGEGGGERGGARGGGGARRLQPDLKLNPLPLGRTHCIL